MARKLNTQDFGMAAVHIACADLLISGFRAFLAGEGLKYDIVVDISGRLIRVQVKGTNVPRLRKQRTSAPPLYQFVTRRNGGIDQNFYRESDVDVVACVAIDTRQVAYLPVVDVFPKAIHLYPAGTPPFIRRGEIQRLVIDQLPFRKAIDRISIDDVRDSAR